jgi:hypothetical protein
MPIDQRWDTLTAADWDAFACAWLAELRGEANDDSDMGQRVVMSMRTPKYTLAG